MLPKPHPPAAEPGPAPTPVLTTRPKRPEDTSAGCRALAAEDLRRAEGLTAEQASWRYQRSAQAWLARADLLDRLEGKDRVRMKPAAR